MKRKKVESFEDLAKHDKDAMNVLIELARLTPPIRWKETILLFLVRHQLVNRPCSMLFLVERKPKTGVGETTTKIKAYNGTGLTFWDVPGRNDEVSYLSMEYISFFKGLTRRVILIQATVKENSSMMKTVG